jgi:hypothetical protein
LAAGVLIYAFRTFGLPASSKFRARLFRKSDQNDTYYDAENEPKMMGQSSLPAQHYDSMTSSPVILQVDHHQQYNPQQQIYYSNQTPYQYSQATIDYSSS